MSRFRHMLEHGWCPLALFFRRAPTAAEIKRREIADAEADLFQHHLQTVALESAIEGQRRQLAMLDQRARARNSLETR